MKLFKIFLLSFAAIYITGCASGAKMENMVYQDAQNNYSNELKNGLEVSQVSGGEETNPGWTSEISSQAFAGALKESLLAQGLLSGSGRYTLTVEMLKVDQPLFGLDFEVTTHVQYTLRDKRDNSIVFNETVIAPHTATVGDSFFAVKRLRLANEGSGKKNIQAFLEKLSILKINKHDISLVE